MIRRKTQREIETMRKAGVIVAEVHRACAEAARPGVSTADLDALAEEVIRSHGAEPTFLGYRGFPASICASINDEVVHGIPSPKRILREGDILKVDVGATYKGLVADAAITVPIGEVPPEVQELIDVTREALMAGLDACRVGRRVGDVSHAVEAVVRAHGFGIVRDYGGHGVGHRLHEDPHVPNYGKPGTGPRLRAGMCLAIEPMVNLGTDDVEVLADGWTVVTADGKWSAHFEHSVAITDAGPLVLTLPEDAPQPFLEGA